MSIIEHILLFNLLFLLFCIWGRYNYNVKYNLDFWFLALVPILSYSLIVGSRYGWGPDYFNYKFQLENASRFEQDQIGFKWLNQTIIMLGFDYTGGFIIYSFIFITSAFVLIRSYGKVSVYMYYFIIPATLIFVSSAIRQGVGLSFVLLALYFLHQKKWLGVTICILIGSSIHSSILVTAAMMGLVYLFIKHPLNWKITIPLYLFSTLFSDTIDISGMKTYIETYVSLDSHFQGYVDNADVWLGEEAASDIYKQNSITLFLSSLFYMSLMYMGYLVLKCRPHATISYVYNVVVVGILFFKVFFLYEILRRFAEPLVMLYFIILGYSFFVIIELKKKRRISFANNYNMFEKKLLKSYKFFIGFILLYLILFFGRFIFLNPDAMFYWNK